MSLGALAASVRTAPAPNVWARLRRMLALGPQQEDVAFAFRHARPPTTLAPFPHYFDSEDDEEAALTDLSEAHAAQVRMSLVALVGSQAPFTVGGVALDGPRSRAR